MACSPAGGARKGMKSIGYERTFARLKACARTAHELEARQQALREETDLVQRELDALHERYDRLRDEQKRTRAALCRRRADRERMARFLETLPDDRGRELLRLRYVAGLTVQQTQQALAEQGRFYGQRHVERLLSEAEQAAAERWTEWMEQEVRNDRKQH